MLALKIHARKIDTRASSPVQSSPPHACASPHWWRLWHRGLVVQVDPQRFDGLIPEKPECSRGSRRDDQGGYLGAVPGTSLVGRHGMAWRICACRCAGYPYASAPPASENNCVPSLIWRPLAVALPTPGAVIIE